MAIILPDKTYRDLIDRITKIYTQTNTAAKQAVGRIRTNAYWEIGKHIIRVEQNNNIRAQYGERLLERLSSDLTSRLGNGFSTTNLKYMRQFYLTHHSIRHSSDELGWTQHRKLLTIRDDQQRKHLEKKCIQKNWSVSDLARAITKEKIETQVFEVKKAEADAKEDHTPLAVKRGRFYIYRVVPFQLEKAGGAQFYIDLGFSIYKEMPSGARAPQDLKNKDIIESKKEGKHYTVIKRERRAGDLFTYKAYMERIIDGDTIWCKIDLGFKTIAREKLRLKGIDSAELHTKKGEQAKQFMEEALGGVDFIVIKTYKTDKYDRPLADIFYLPARQAGLPAGKAGLPGEADAGKVAREGSFLNQELLDRGLAKKFK